MEVLSSADEKLRLYVATHGLPVMLKVEPQVGGRQGFKNSNPSLTPTLAYAGGKFL